MTKYDKQKQFETVEKFVEDFNQKVLMDIKADILLDNFEDHGISFETMTKKDLVDYALEIIDKRLEEGFEDNRKENKK